MHFDDLDLLEKKMAAEIYRDLVVKYDRPSEADADFLLDCQTIRDRAREIARVYYEDLKGE
jgi:hypothetical protein